ncbi:hypothetical protein V2O64_12245 [Verrucomicrobiaceae bacterium 227]
MALWFSLLTMSVVAVICSVTGEQYHHEYLYNAPLETLPLLSRLFFSRSGWLFYFPLLFALPTIWVTWKRRHDLDLIWCLVTINLGSTIIHLALFHLAVRLPEFLSIRMMEG